MSKIYGLGIPSLGMVTNAGAAVFRFCRHIPSALRAITGVGNAVSRTPKSLSNREDTDRQSGSESPPVNDLVSRMAQADEEGNRRIFETFYADEAVPGDAVSIVPSAPREKLATTVRRVASAAVRGFKAVVRYCLPPIQ